MKICIIGASGHFRYALAQLKRNELVGIARGFETEDLSKLKTALIKEGIPFEEFEDYTALLDIADVAVVNTRFDLNADISVKCLEKNVYVFSEKPLATSLLKLEMLKDAQSKSKAFVTAMFGIRYSAWFLTLKDAVSDIGDIRLINAQKSYILGDRPDFFKSKETFGGIIPWVAIHAIDWIHALVGQPFTEIHTVTDNGFNHGYGDLEMTALCTFKTESGVLASVTADYHRPDTAPAKADDRIRVVGTHGVVEYMDGQLKKIGSDGITVLPMKDEADVFELFLRRVQGENVGVSPEESFYVTEVSLP